MPIRVSFFTSFTQAGLLGEVILTDTGTTSKAVKAFWAVILLTLPQITDTK